MRSLNEGFDIIVGEVRRDLGTSLQISPECDVDVFVGFGDDADAEGHPWRVSCKVV